MHFFFLYQIENHSMKNECSYEITDWQILNVKNI
jgi:hypothetical protein